MIDKKLEKLVNFIKDIEKTKPFDFLEKNISTFEKELIDLSDQELQICTDFEEDVILVYEKYKEKDVFNPVLLCILYNTLVNLLKQSKIEKKAEELNISKNMYSKQMDFLFKGKK